ncbi:RNA-binding cell elongation regulator Jag/EloR [Lacticaseibacillus hulanensis]|uniref:RNA-binding cell elongation regulator Jag/EloR n=1 Tax=Lacticaseibacillus hulanensis TaxID=2493111 RepID=UPI000FD8D300|nr:RNA-binding cell elongation regulator Jag/EloR [Lacticaseibacillus hulanensis]
MPTYEGKTIEAAIEAGLQALQLTQDDVQIDVVNDAKRGFLGFGSRLAKVTITPKEQPVTAPAAEPAAAAPVAPASAQTKQDPAPAEAATDEAAAELAEKKRREKRQQINNEALAAVQEYLEHSIAALGIQAAVTQKHISGGVMFQIDADKDALLIGKHGKTINSLQFLAQTLFNHRGRAKWTIMLNVGDYRQRRDESVRRLAQKTAREVLASGKTVYLDPMPSFERKAIHHELQDNQYATTRSEGVEPHRYVVVVPRR